MIKTISRNNLHYNFLKTILLRLDFQGVLDSEMSIVLKGVKEIALEMGFSRYSEASGTLKELAEVTNDNTIDWAPGNVYSFINDNSGYTLYVSTTFICLLVNSPRYVPFEQYQNIIPSVSQIYANHIKFLTFKRFGMRKINECIIKDKVMISEFFKEDYFNYYDFFQDANIIQSNHVNIFSKDSFAINLITGIQQGKKQKEDVYKITLDIDIYIDDAIKVDDYLNSIEKQKEANELAFKIYTTLLTDSFIEKLSSEECVDYSFIEGIEQND